MLGGREAIRRARSRGAYRKNSPFRAGRRTVAGVIGLVGAGLLFCFACLVTAHLAIALALFGRRPRLRGLLSLLPPLAPLALYWAVRDRMYVLAGFWGLSLVAYLLCLRAAYM